MAPESALVSNPHAIKTFGFGLKAFRKFPELLPLVTCLSAALGMCTFFSAYALYQKPDVKFYKRHECPPWEDVNPEQKQKFLTYRTKYQKIPELEALKKEIGSYKY